MLRSRALWLRRRTPALLAGPNLSLASDVACGSQEWRRQPLEQGIPSGTRGRPATLGPQFLGERLTQVHGETAGAGEQPARGEGLSRFQLAIAARALYGARVDADPEAWIESSHIARIEAITEMHGLPAREAGPLDASVDRLKHGLRQLPSLQLIERGREIVVRAEANAIGVRKPWRQQAAVKPSRDVEVQLEREPDRAVEIAPDNGSLAIRSH